MKIEPGYDFSPEAIATAKTEAQNLGLTNIQFQVKDAATIGEIAKSYP
ncbi:methyltransferase domain-containing protein [Fischerella thermalis]|nr:methyltransferase domain-containing protein [Fischerella thermalis]